MSASRSSLGVKSWGRLAELQHRGLSRPQFRDSPWPELDATVLPFGNGRSYGDSCLNAEGYLLSSRGLDRFLAFDRETGRIRCEAGVLLKDILELAVPAGWFLPVTPGTQYVTVGGAIANDVHGKNHHVAGSFGHHLSCFELLRSDGERRLCSADSHPELFHATIGGLGLTGFITWAEFCLKPIANPCVRAETLPFAQLGDFFTLADQSDLDYEYTVAWIDCLAEDRNPGRGLFFRANHAEPDCDQAGSRPGRRMSVPFDPPVSLVNKASLRLFNNLYYRKQSGRESPEVQYYEPFFYPLDGVQEWNRIYGPKGFYQFQSVVPLDDAENVTRAMLSAISRSGQGSFLSVLKRFGTQKSIGMLSFPRPGVSLALDFPNRGRSTFELLDRLERLVTDAKGAIYPAKDARMSASAFAAGFPGAVEFCSYIDTACSSSFWRRVSAGLT